MREQILDFTDSGRMQGPCCTNFSTKEWSMLTGLGKQISAFLKISHAKLDSENLRKTIDQKEQNTLKSIKNSNSKNKQNVSKNQKWIVRRF